MKLTIERTALLDAMSRVSRIAPTKSTILVLQNVLISAGSSGLRLKASDLDIEYSENVEAEISKSGDTTVPAKMLYDIVRKVPDGAQIIIEQPEGKPLAVKAGRSRFTLQTLPSSDFPQFGNDGMEHAISIPASELSRLFDKTQFAASTEETRYYLNGVYLHADDGNLVAVATDGHRLAKCVCGLPDGAAGIPAVIVPRKTVAEVQKLAVGSDEDVQISISGTKIRFVFGNSELNSKLIDGTFPDYKRVIPAGQNMIAGVDVGNLESAVGRVATVSTDRGRVIKLAFGNGLLSLQQRSDAGESEEEIEVDYDADDLAIGFNSKYLQDILAVLDTERVDIALTDPASPAAFRPVGSDNLLLICMPVRIQ